MDFHNDFKEKDSFKLHKRGKQWITYHGKYAKLLGGVALAMTMATGANIINISNAQAATEESTTQVSDNDDVIADNLETKSFRDASEDTPVTSSVELKDRSGSTQLDNNREDQKTSIIDIFATLNKGETLTIDTTEFNKNNFSTEKSMPGLEIKQVGSKFIYKALESGSYNLTLNGTIHLKYLANYESSDKERTATLKAEVTNSNNDNILTKNLTYNYQYNVRYYDQSKPANENTHYIGETYTIHLNGSTFIGDESFKGIPDFGFYGVKADGSIELPDGFVLEGIYDYNGRVPDENLTISDKHITFKNVNWKSTDQEIDNVLSSLEIVGHYTKELTKENNKISYTIDKMSDENTTVSGLPVESTVQLKSDVNALDSETEKNILKEKGNLTSNSSTDRSDKIPEKHVQNDKELWGVIIKDGIDSKTGKKFSENPENRQLNHLITQYKNKSNVTLKNPVISYKIEKGTYLNANGQLFEVSNGDAKRVEYNSKINKFIVTYADGSTKDLLGTEVKQEENKVGTIYGFTIPDDKNVINIQVGWDQLKPGQKVSLTKVVTGYIDTDKELGSVLDYEQTLNADNLDVTKIYSDNLTLVSEKLPVDRSINGMIWPFSSDGTHRPGDATTYDKSYFEIASDISDAPLGKFYVALPIGTLASNFKFSNDNVPIDINDVVHIIGIDKFGRQIVEVNFGKYSKQDVFKNKNDASNKNKKIQINYDIKIDNNALPTNLIKYDGTLIDKNEEGTTSYFVVKDENEMSKRYVSTPIDLDIVKFDNMYTYGSSSGGYKYQVVVGSSFGSRNGIANPYLGGTHAPYDASNPDSVAIMSKEDGTKTDDNQDETTIRLAALNTNNTNADWSYNFVNLDDNKIPVVLTGKALLTTQGTVVDPKIYYSETTIDKDHIDTTTMKTADQVTDWTKIKAVLLETGKMNNEGVVSAIIPVKVVDIDKINVNTETQLTSTYLAGTLNGTDKATTYNNDTLLGIKVVGRQNVTTKYVFKDEDGNVETTHSVKNNVQEFNVGDKYETKKLNDIDIPEGYSLKETIGEPTGTVKENQNVEVTYVYQKAPETTDKVVTNKFTYTFGTGGESTEAIRNANAINKQNNVVQYVTKTRTDKVDKNGNVVERGKTTVKFEYSGYDNKLNITPPMPIKGYDVSSMLNTSTYSREEYEPAAQKAVQDWINSDKDEDFVLTGIAIYRPKNVSTKVTFTDISTDKFIDELSFNATIDTPLTLNGVDEKIAELKKQGYEFVSSDVPENNTVTISDYDNPKSFTVKMKSKQKATITVHDITTNTDLETIDVLGDSGESVMFTENQYKAYREKGYLPADSKLAYSRDIGKFDSDFSKDQNFVVNVKHAMIEFTEAKDTNWWFTQDGTDSFENVLDAVYVAHPLDKNIGFERNLRRNIDLVIKGQSKPVGTIIQSYNQNRKAIMDAVTGEVKMGDWKAMGIFSNPISNDPTHDFKLSMEDSYNHIYQNLVDHNFVPDKTVIKAGNFPNDEAKDVVLSTETVTFTPNVKQIKIRVEDEDGILDILDPKIDGVDVHEVAYGFFKPGSIINEDKNSTKDYTNSRITDDKLPSRLDLVDIPSEWTDSTAQQTWDTNITSKTKGVTNMSQQLLDIIRSIEKNYGLTFVSDDRQNMMNDKGEYVIDEDLSTPQTITLKFKTHYLPIDKDGQDKRLIPYHNYYLIVPDGVSHADLNKETKRTIHYVYEDGSKAKDDVIQSVTQTRTARVNQLLAALELQLQAFKDEEDDEGIQLITDEINTLNAKGFKTIEYTDFDKEVVLDTVVTPNLKGYTPDIKQVESSNHDKEVTVTYRANKQSINFNIIDNDKDNTKVDIDTPTTIDGNTGKDVDVTDTVDKIIKELTDKGYVVDKTDIPTGKVPFNNDGTPKDFTIKVSHKVVEVTTPVNTGDLIDPSNPDGPKYTSTVTEKDITRNFSRTVKFVDQNGKEIATKVVDKAVAHGKVTMDLVTGEVSFPEFNEITLPAVDKKEIAGYHSVMPRVEELTIQPDIYQEWDQDIETSIIYQRNDAAGLVIRVNADDKVMIAVPVIVKPGQKLDLTSTIDKIEKHMNKRGYKLVKQENIPTEIAKDAKDTIYGDLFFEHDLYEVPLDKIPDGELKTGEKVNPDDPDSPTTPENIFKYDLDHDVNYSVDYRDATGILDSDDQKIHVTRKAFIDRVTGKLIYKDWTTDAKDGFHDVTPPTTWGTPDKTHVDGMSLEDILKDPTDTTIDVYYDREAVVSTATVEFFDQDTDKPIIALPLRGFDNKEITQNGIDAINKTLDLLTKRGYELVSSNLPEGNKIIFDKKTQNFKVILKHSTVSVDENNVPKPGTPIDETNTDVKYPDLGDSSDFTKVIKRVITFTDRDTTVHEPLEQDVTIHRTVTIDKVTGNIITDTWTTGNFEKVDVPEIENYITNVTEIPGQEVTNTTEVTNINVPFTKVNGSDVTVKYVDQSGNEIAPSETLTGKINDKYHAISKLIDGYTLLGVPENGNGAFTDKSQIVTFTYAKNVVRGGDVTIKRVDVDGNQLVPDETIHGNVNESYHTIASKVDGYTIVKVPSNANGVFNKDAQTVTFVYAKNVTKGANVTVNYIDENGNEIAKSIVLHGNVGVDYTSDQLNIDGYTFKEVRGDQSGKFGLAESTIEYVYTKNVDKTPGQETTTPEDKTPKPNENNNTKKPDTPTDAKTPELTTTGTKPPVDNKAPKEVVETKTIPTQSSSTSTSNSNTNQNALPQTDEKSDKATSILGLMMLATEAAFGLSFSKKRKDDK